MKRIRELVVMLGADRADSVSPVLDGRFPLERVRVLHPPGAAAEAERLARLVAHAPVEVVCTELIHSLRMQALREQLRDICAECAPGATALNVSGVPSLLAVPASQIFAGAGHAVLAVEPDSDTVLWLSAPETGEFQSFNVADRLTLPDYLAAHGLEWHSARATLRRPEDRLDRSARYIAQLACRSGNALRTMSRLACDAGSAGLTAPLPPRTDARSLHDFARHLVDRGLARLGERGRLAFSGETERIFVAGGWFEHLIFMAGRALARTGQIQDAAAAVQIRLSPALLMEWDVALLANNALYVIECKARGPRWARSGLGTQVVHKLDAEGRMKGLVSHSMLATIFPMAPDDTERAALHRVQMLCLTETNNVGAVLARWTAGPAEASAASGEAIP